MTEPVERGEAEALLTTGDMARLGNSTLRTIRFYESHGLLKSSSRDGGSHRRFERCELSKLQVIAGLRDAGLSLDEIKELMALKASGGACPQQASEQVKAALNEQRGRLDSRIATLQSLRDEVDGTLRKLDHCHDCDCTNFPSDCTECSSTKLVEPTGLTRLVWGG